jgi:hypothetical protein
MTDNTQTLHNAENERLKKQLDIAMKALEFYADESNWTRSAIHEGDTSSALAQQAIEDVENVK